MLSCAQAQFVQEPGVEGEDLLVLMEMTLKNLAFEGQIDHRDFLDRVDILSTLGKTVLVSNYAEFHRLAAYLFRYTKKKIGIALGRAHSARDFRREVLLGPRGRDSANHSDACLRTTSSFTSIRCRIR